MDLRRRVGALEIELERERTAARVLAEHPGAVAHERDVATAEITGSLRFAGSALDPAEIALLARTGLTPAGASLEACNAVADYAAAAAHVAALGRQRRRAALITVEDIVALHALATRRSTSDRPGVWRSLTAATLRGGAVAPPAWLVPRDVAAFAERFAGGVPAGGSFLLWIADFHARLTRIHPFATANGRVARLCLNLLLARLRYPPLILGPRDGAPFTEVLDRAAAGDLWPSAAFFGRRLVRVARDGSHEPVADPLVALSQVAGRDERDALYKASQRGRLRTIRRGTSVFTTKTWLEEYRSSRAAAGRPRTQPRPHF